MNEHKLDPLSRNCVGCGAQAREIMEIGPKCPAFYRQFVDRDEQMMVIIDQFEKLRVYRFRKDAAFASEELRLSQEAMFALRDAIFDGVRELREEGRSHVSPR